MSKVGVKGRLGDCVEGSLSENNERHTKIGCLGRWIVYSLKLRNIRKRIKVRC